MSRTMVQVGVGGRTLVTSAVSASLLIIVVLSIGSLFEELPKGPFMKDVCKIFGIFTLSLFYCLSAAYYSLQAFLGVACRAKHLP